MSLDDDIPKVNINVEETLLDKCEVCKEVKNIKQDPCLQNWQKWIKERQNVHRVLEQNVHRKPNQLLMNAFDDEKSIKEEKLVLEYTNIPEPDQQRGCPAFWKVAPSLTEACGAPKYFAIPAKSDACSIPEIDYVKCPDVIKTEKEATTIR